MSSLTAKIAKHLTSSSARPSSSTSLVAGVQKGSKLWCSTLSGDGGKNGEAEDFHEDVIVEKREALLQGVDPGKGWSARGVHRAIICGKLRQPPVQKLLRNGKTLTIFNVGTGGMWDHRSMADKDMPKPAQWHRVVCHNETLGAYAVQKLLKGSSVYVEGDIELRVYNKGITRETIKLPEICVRRDGKIRLIQAGENTTNIPFDELREGLV